MNRCPISYQLCGQEKYSSVGLSLLSKSLKQLKDLPFSAKEQRREAATRMKRMSIQGVQPKISAVLNTRKSTFEVVDQNGKYIIKPQSDIYLQIPENEDVSMRMAKVVGIEVPLHGMIYSKDGSLSYFIKRFDRIGWNKKLSVEDFSQLAGMSRDTKYDFTTEKMIHLIEEYCTFPNLEKIKFFRLILFSFLIGNEDMHIKNFSLITRKQKVEFSPAYDLLNSTLVLDGSEEELALLLKGKRNNFKRRELIDYLGIDRLGLTKRTIEKIENDFKNAFSKWQQLLEISFLSQSNKIAYSKLLQERFKRLELL